MNYIKRILIVTGIFLLLVFLLSLFFPSSKKVTKELLLDNSFTTVEKQLTNFKMDQLLSYSSKEGLQWDISSEKNGVNLNASLILDVGFNPIVKFKGLFDEEELNSAFAAKIDSLKAFIENLPKIQMGKVEKVFLSETQWFLSIRDTVNQQEMSNIHGKLYAKINQYMDVHGIESDSAPLIIYHLWTDSVIDVEAGIPILDSIGINDSLIKLKKITPRNVVTAIHYGSYERLPETYFGINEWMRRNKVIVTGPPWESYITDPTKEEDSEKWQTAIFFPVE